MHSKIFKSMAVAAVVLAAAAMTTAPAFAAVSQPVTQEIASPDEPVQAMLGDGVESSDCQMNGYSAQFALFETPEDMGLPFNSGVILSTGNAQAAFDKEGQSTPLYGDGDAYLASLSEFSTYDAAAMSFALTPTSEFLTFDYFFASNEYDQPPRYNDVFALVVVDSETGEQFNIAMTPAGKITNVANTVTMVNGEKNYTKNSKYYTYNPEYTVNGYGFGYQGYSSKFTANASKLVNSKGNKVIQNGKPVLLYLAVADVSDSVKDTAIFIKGNSLNFIDADEKVYTVVFNPNGGTCDTPALVTGTDGTLETLPVAVLEGDEFLGWFTYPTEDGEMIDLNTVFEKDTMVFAHWKYHKVAIPDCGPDCEPVAAEMNYEEAEPLTVSAQAESTNGVPQTGEGSLAGIALLALIGAFSTVFIIYRTKKM